ALIGKSILTKTDAKDLVVTVYRHQPLSLDDARSSDPGQRDPNHNRTFVRAYAAKIRLNLAGDAEVSVDKEALDVAAPNRASSNSTPTTPNARQSNPTPPPRSKPNRQRADPLPQPERPQNSSTLPSLPPSLRGTDPLADPNAPQK